MQDFVIIEKGITHDNKNLTFNNTPTSRVISVPR